MLSILIRVSNTSNADAVLYFETMSVELKWKGIWHKVMVLFPDPGWTPGTDFDESQKVTFGIDEVKWLTRYENQAITRNTPLLRYMAVTADDRDLLRHCDCIKVQVRDCYRKMHTMVVDFSEQKKLDPTRFFTDVD
jgi:hypothetical protein